MKIRGLLMLIIAACILVAFPQSLCAQSDGGNTLRVIPYTVMATTDEPVSVLTFSPDGSKLLGASGSSVIIWDAVTLEESQTIQNGEAAVKVVKISPDSGSFLAVLDDGTVIVRSIENFQELVHFKINSVNPVMDASFLTNTYSVAIPMDDGTTLCNCFILMMTGNIIPEKIAEFEGMIYAVDANREGTALLASTADGGVHYINTETDEIVASYVADTEVALPAAFFPDGESFIYAAEDGILTVRNIAGEVLFTVTVPEKPCCRVVFSPDGKSFAVPAEDDTIRIYDSENGSLVLSLKAPASSDGSHRILDAAFSPDGDYLFTTFENGQLIRWTLNSLFISEMSDGGTSYQNRDIPEWMYQLPYIPASVSQVTIPNASLFLGAGYTVLLESYYPGSFDVDFVFKKRINETSMVWGAELTGGTGMPNERYPYAYHLNEQFGGGDLPAPWLYSFAPLAVLGYELYDDDDNRLFFDVFAGPRFRFLWDNSFAMSLSTRLYPSVEAGIAAGLDFKGFTAKVSFAYNTQVAFTASCTIGYSFRFKPKGEEIYEMEDAVEEEELPVITEE